MIDVERMLSVLDRVSDWVEQLQLGLHHRQEDLLALEDRVHDLAGHEHGGLVIVDQTEDLRRTIGSHSDLYLLPIQQGMKDVGSTAIGDDLTDRAIREANRASEHLDAVLVALARTSRALPSDPTLEATARKSVDKAAGQLENARRAVFRLGEDLPVIVAGVRGGASVSPDVRDSPIGDQQVGQIDRVSLRVASETHDRARTSTTFEPGANVPPR